MNKVIVTSIKIAGAIGFAIVALSMLPADAADAAQAGIERMNEQPPGDFCLGRQSLHGIEDKHLFLHSWR